jgi:hydrogenase expression/formation protein HypC
MCLSFPGKVVGVKGEYATVDYGEDGVRDNVNVSLVDAHIGSYVLIQGGFAIKVMSKDEAEEVLDTWKLLRELQEA